MRAQKISLLLRNAGHTRWSLGVPGYTVDGLGVWEHDADGRILSPGPAAKTWAHTLTAAGYDVLVAADHLIVTDRNGQT